MVTLADPIKVTVYSRDRVRLGVVANPSSIAGVERHNGTGTWTLALDPLDPMIPDLLTPGARCVFEHRGAVVGSGKVRTDGGDVLGHGPASFQIYGDRRILTNTLAYPQPWNPIRPTQIRNDNVGAGQAWYPALSSDYEAGTVAGQWGYYYWPLGLTQETPTSDTIEGILKSLVRVNYVQRLGRALTIAADQARGGDAFAALQAGIIQYGTVRFGTLAEVIDPVLAATGLGLYVRQIGTQLVLDLYEPTTWPAKLTAESGIVQGGTYTRRRPTSTRSIVGGPGELAARAFRDYRDTTGREAEEGEVIESFRDATGGTLQWPGSVADRYRVPAYFHLRPEVPADARASFETYLETAGRKGLAEGVATTSLNVELAESGTFFVGPGGIRLGDLVTILVRGQDVTDRVTEVAYSYTRAGGVTVTPSVGNREDDADRRLASIVAKIASGQRRLSTDR